jgi:hypothetical protein
MEKEMESAIYFLAPLVAALLIAALAVASGLP